MDSKDIINSPIYYSGSKYSAIRHGLLDLFPKDIDTLYEPFCGSCIVSLNTDAKRYVISDKSSQLIQIINMFKRPKHILLNSLDTVIHDLELQSDLYPNFDIRSKLFNEEHYNFHKEQYNKLRDVYNDNRDIVLFLYLLTIYSFSHQIRFDAKGNFNMPVGPGKFTDYNRNNIETFCDWITNNNVLLYDLDYKKVLDICLISCGKNDFIYLDPPYYGTVATYNENGGWTLEDDYNLFNYLDDLTKKSIKWGMSNVILTRDKNAHLLHWAKSQGYNIYVLDGVKYAISYDDYENANRKEVYITDY